MVEVTTCIWIDLVVWMEERYGNMSEVRKRLKKLAQLKMVE